jgi:glycosyltransferase involved in cell wall biosynthesis
MKILLVNKFYYERDGVTRCVFDTQKILERQGHKVAIFSMRHPLNKRSNWEKYFTGEIDYNKKTALLEKIKLACKIFYNREAAQKLTQLIKDFQPDVAHLHNIYHHLSPSVIYTLAKYHVPMVMTLHDYKLICPNYSLFLRGRIWEKCQQGRFYQCIWNRCVKDSYLKSLLAAAEAYLSKRVYRKIKLFFAPSLFLKNKFEEYGFKGTIKHLPNAFLTEKTPFAPLLQQNNYLFYAGRLSAEKGVDVLITAMSSVAGIKLIIAGDGPARGRLKKLTNELGLTERIQFVGQQNKADLFRLIKDAEIIIVPSIWYENLPYAVMEAMGLTKIVVCSKVGGLPEMVKDGKTGFFFKTGDARDLALVIQRVLNLSESERNQIGEAAKKIVRGKYSPDKYYQTLINYYQQAAKL